MSAIVSMEHIQKSFAGVPALRDITFDVQPGEVHALLGENGAGKSTLMKILSGAYQPTSGTLVLDGQRHDVLTPSLSSDFGISIIYQELSVINQLSVAENIFVGRQPVRRRWGLPMIDRQAMEQRTHELLERVGLDLDMTRTVGSLSISEKQMVEILKAVAFDARVIVMDEPSSSLTESEVEKLFEIIRTLSAQGTAVVYITHKLKEVIAIADRVTVLKDGEVVSSEAVADVTLDSLVNAMVGRTIKGTYRAAEGDIDTSQVVLKVENLTRKDRRVKDVSFDLHRGEVLGFSGLVGAGRTELMAAIYGAEPKSAGTVTINGREVDIRNPFDALQAGLALVSEDRRHSGFFDNFSIKRNFAITVQLKESRWGGLWGLVNRAQELEVAQTQMVSMRVKCRDLEQNIVELSGGNQQKVLLGRWMAAGAEVIIFDEPTKGIDVGTKSEIYTLMRNLAQAGVGVIVVSSELPEVLAVCDRILVFAEGEVQAEYLAADATEENLVRAATMSAAH